MEGDGVQAVEDETQAHVGGSVVKITEHVHGLCAPFGAELSVELVGSSQLVGRGLCNGGTGGQEMK